MTTIFTTSLNPQWFYPVVDPYRTAGPGPYFYAYVFGWDAVMVTVTRNPSLSRCQMRVELSSTLAEAKQIQAFNFYNDTWHDQIDSDPSGAVTAMTIKKRKPGEDLRTGTDTVVLARATWIGPKGMYAFWNVDFWDFWGGCTVRFDWSADRSPDRPPSGRSGDQTPPPRYPIVQLPDGTLMRNAAGPGLSVVFGGTDFPADSAYLDAMVLDTNAATAEAVRAPGARDLLGLLGGRDSRLIAGAVAFQQLPAFPADFTLIRELNSPEVFVVFGGAKFQIPDPQTLYNLGFTWSMVRVIPAGGMAKLRTVPIDGTLIKEQNDPRIFLVENDQLRWVKSPGVIPPPLGRLYDPPSPSGLAPWRWSPADPRCLPGRHVRTVPDTALAALPHGHDLDLP